MWPHPDPVDLVRTAQSVLAAVYPPPPSNPEFHFVLVIKTQVLKHSTHFVSKNALATAKT